jgi:hypothetical protein
MLLTQPPFNFLLEKDCREHYYGGYFNYLPSLPALPISITLDHITLSMSKQSKKKDCIICGKISSSYKCPRCFAFYCSKDCCTSHKEFCSISAGESSILKNTASTPIKTDSNNTSAENHAIIPNSLDIAVAEVSSIHAKKNEHESAIVDESAKQVKIGDIQLMNGNDVVRSLQDSLKQKEQAMADNDPDFIFQLKQDVFLLSDENKRRLREHPQLQTLLRSKRLMTDLEIVDKASDRTAALRTMREKNKEFNDVVELMCDIVKKS